MPFLFFGSYHHSTFGALYKPAKKAKPSKTAWKRIMKGERAIKLDVSWGSEFFQTKAEVPAVLADVEFEQRTEKLADLVEGERKAVKEIGTATDGTRIVFEVEGENVPFNAEVVRALRTLHPNAELAVIGDIDRAMLAFVEGGEVQAVLMQIRGEIGEIALTEAEEKAKPKKKSDIVEKKITDKEVWEIFNERKSEIEPTIGKYAHIDTQEKIIAFIRENANKQFFSKAVNANFEVSEITINHLYKKNRPKADYARRTKLFAPGLEIVETAGVLVSTDRVSDSDKGIVYYEIIGYDENIPDTIIRVKLSEQNKNGKVYLTISDISVGAPVPETPSSGRRPGRITTSDIDTSSIAKGKKKVKSRVSPKLPQQAVSSAKTLLMQRGIAEGTSERIAGMIDRVAEKSKDASEKDIQFIADTINHSTRAVFEEITGIKLVPNVKVNYLGNLGASYAGDLSSLKIEDGSYSFVTYEGLKRLSFKDETYDRLSSEFGYVQDDLTKSKSKRDEEKANANDEATAGRMKKGTREDIFFEDLGFDHITLDEVQNANHIVSKVKLQKGQASEYARFSLQPPARSERDLYSNTGVATPKVSEFLSSARPSI